MIESIFLPDNQGCVWGSNDEDFENRLLMHCEAHAHKDEPVVDTTFDEDDDDESISSFAMIQISSGEHTETPSDAVSNTNSNDTPTDAIHIFSTIHEESETGIEVIMQRLCESCAMDVTDVTDFEEDECPFCLAVKNFDLVHSEDDSSSLNLDGSRIYIEDGDFHDKKQLNSTLLTALARVDGMRGVKENLQTIETKEGRQKELLKGMIATFLQQNKNAQGRQRTTRVVPTKEDTSLTLDSRDDISPLMNGGRKENTRTYKMSSGLRNVEKEEEVMRRFNLYYSNLHRLREPKTFETAAKPSLMIETKRTCRAPLVYVDTHLDVRYKLLQLENYYSKQQTGNYVVG